MQPRIINHAFVYREPGRFAGWPANNGIWIWGNEILVGFVRAHFLERAEENEHSYDPRQGRQRLLARSLDGGLTWSLEDPAPYFDNADNPPPCPGGIDFAHPDFAMRFERTHFFVSYDRGRTWQPPLLLPPADDRKLTARTDYLVNGPDDCHFFLSAEEPAVATDRSFCVRTTDAGKSFDFLSWITPIAPPERTRSVMSSTVRASDGQLVTALRRRIYPQAVHDEFNWIDAYASPDDGATWQFLSRVTYTDLGGRNGNPPCLLRLRSGPLCLTYAVRALPYRICARLSHDNGRTWAPEIPLRQDGRNWDLGYTRSVQRPDGQVVTIYYFTTLQHPEQHIAVTIWDPSSL